MAMKIQTRRQIIAALSSLRRDALSREIHSKRDEITRDAQVSVLEACLKRILTNAVTERGQLSERLTKWHRQATMKQRGAAWGGYSRDVAHYQGVASACVAVLSLL
jgi:hypothetical protein